MRNAIKYKETWALPGSNLHRLLTEASQAKDPKKAAELRTKAEAQYQETEKNFRKQSGL